MTPEPRRDLDLLWRVSLQPPPGGEAALRQALLRRRRAPHPRFALASLASLVVAALVAVQFAVRDRSPSTESQPASVGVPPVQYRVAVTDEAVSLYVLHARSIAPEDTTAQ